MPRMKMAAKRPRREMPPSPSSDDEDFPSKIRIAKCPVLIGKNVDLGSFTFEAHSFHIEDLFIGMSWISILTLDDKVYSSIFKDLYKNMSSSPGSGISYLLRNKRIRITRGLIRSILHLEEGGVRLYTTKIISHTEEYNPVEACCLVADKHFEAVIRLSTNQLTLPCRVLHNIIAHIIVPRKGHLDEVNHYDVFLLDSILHGRKFDFSYIMIQHMTSVLSGIRPKVLPYRMILTRIFQHFEISFRDPVAVLPKATDTINILTLKRMKIFKKKDNGWQSQKGLTMSRDHLRYLSRVKIYTMTKMLLPRPHLDHDHIDRRPPPPASTQTILLFLMVGLTHLHLLLMAYNMP
ncbi:Uncharacterized protein Adt_11207 [Abeliophyllum distichum]|uniref:Putative plant transposon protein domain-containing protein n=1 Tax=Abeliophyllum distichum TaxID=126358 RepID=A0ABD1UM67_9LAMI